MAQNQPKKIAILGSTGSIGRQTLEVVEASGGAYSVEALTACNNVELLISQARKFLPKVVCIANENHFQTLKNALFDLPISVLAGDDGLLQVAEYQSVEVVLTAMVGYAGLRPTIEAIKAGKTIALANKETLVVAGELVCALAKKHNVAILPVDSEHSAIFQSLLGEEISSVEKILLTASGGPFLKKSLDELRSVTPAQALKHPNWSMGAKITIDSASMMNKGFEVIEAKWLFDLNADKIEVLVHPQSIVHSMVQFVDGSVKAQLGAPDMRLPIQFALSFPKREKSNFERWDFWKNSTLTFEKPDTTRFRNLALAFEAMKKGGNFPCVLNAANEIVVEAFLKEKIGFLQMSEIIEKTLEKADFIGNPTLEDYINCDDWARKTAREMLK